jgi:peptide deformylase
MAVLQSSSGLLRNYSMTRSMIRFWPDPILQMRAEEVEMQTKQFIDSLVSELIDLANWTGAVGFAAPQIGVSLRVIIYQDHDGAMRELINPEIHTFSTLRDVEKEGCMSLPGVELPVRRSKSIIVSDLFSKNIRVSGFPARIIQHEVDHLDGIMILDRHKEL